MRRRFAVAVALLGVAGLAACEQQEQTLPFGLSNDPMERTIGAQGGTVSSTAGASLQFPAGALPGNVTVSVTPRQTAPAVVQASGTHVARASFDVLPAGQALDQPAAVGIRLIDAGAAQSDAWLASLVNVTPSGVEELGESDVDLTTGIVRSKIGTLGTLAAVIPAPDAMFSVGAITGTTGAPATRAPSFAALPTRSLTVDCGAPANRCSGLVVQASQSLLDRAADVRAIFPGAKGRIDIDPVTSSATGTLVLQTPVRVKLSSRVGSATVPVRIAVAAVAGQSYATESTSGLTLHNVTLHVKAAGETTSTTVDLPITRSGTSAWIDLSRTFDLGDGEMATIRVTVPLNRSE